jgi:hypothetical protein
MHKNGEYISDSFPVLSFTPANISAPMNHFQRRKAPNDEHKSRVREEDEEGEEDEEEEDEEEKGREGEAVRRGDERRRSAVERYESVKGTVERRAEDALEEMNPLKEKRMAE